MEAFQTRILRLRWTKVKSKLEQITAPLRLLEVGGLRQKLGWSLFFFLTACVFTWPLVLHLPTHLPLGTETAATVPLFNLWTLMWNAQRLIHGYAGYWNAPIFFPEPGTFALSDPQPLTGVIFALPYYVFHNPVLAYNLVFLGFLMMNGLAPHPGVRGTSSPLSRRERGEDALKRDGSVTTKFWHSDQREEALRRASIDARNRDFSSQSLLEMTKVKVLGNCHKGLLMGLFAQSLPFVTREWGVLQLVAVFPLIYSVRALVQFGEKPNLRAGLVFGAWVVVTFLTSSYYGLFLLLVLLVGGLMFVRRAHFRARALGALLAGVALASVVLFPILSAQRRLTAQYIRTEATIEANSAWGVDYLRLDGRMWGEGIVPWLGMAGGSGQRLYPGTGLLLLAVVGVFLAGKRRPREVGFYLLGAGLAMGVSFGLNLEIGGVQPYQWIRDFVPGFAQLRSPFRMGVLVQVFLLGLAGLGVERTRILRLRKASAQDASLWRGSKIKMIWLLLVGGVALLEVVAWPARVWDAERVVRPPEWVGWLATQPTGAAARIPFAESGAVEDFEGTTLGMVWALTHRKPLVNGYSGFFPENYRDLSLTMLHQFPNENSLARLREAEVRYLLVERGWLSPEREVGLVALGVRRIFEGEEMVIFEVTPVFLVENLQTDSQYSAR